jgi:hypothetical protein
MRGLDSPLGVTAWLMMIKFVYFMVKKDSIKKLDVNLLN